MTTKIILFVHDGDCPLNDVITQITENYKKNHWQNVSNTFEYVEANDLDCQNNLISERIYPISPQSILNGELDHLNFDEVILNDKVILFAQAKDKAESLRKK